MTFLRKKTGHPSDVLVDPWPDAKRVGRPNLDDPNEAPAGWAGLTPETRERVGGVCLEEDPPGFRLGPWKRLRARILRGGDGSEGPAIAKALEPLYIDDHEERARWEKAIGEITNPELRAGGLLLIGEVHHKLRLAGDVIATLRARRAAIDREIERLERRATPSIVGGELK